jgi:hypothetical protein
MDDDPEGLKRRTSERIAEVRARFAAGIGARAQALAGLAGTAGAADREAAAKAAEDLRLGLHNLAGGAPTLGLAVLGQAAAALEKRLVAQRLPDGGLAGGVADELAAEIGKLPALA